MKYNALIILSFIPFYTIFGQQEDSNNFKFADLYIENNRVYSNCIQEYEGDVFWEIKDVSRNCLPAPPEDCMVICLQKVSTKYPVANQFSGWKNPCEETDVLTYQAKSRPDLFGLTAEVGKCYVCCYIQDAFVPTVKSIDVGDPRSQHVGSMEVEYMAKPAFTKWIKLPTGEACQSGNKQCISWQAQSIPALMKSIKIPLTDGVVPEVYSVDGYKHYPGGFTEWRELNCPQSSGPNDIIAKVIRALEKYGYSLETDRVNNTFGENVKEALEDFQKKNDLPIGNLDAETIKKLGVGMK